MKKIVVVSLTTLLTGCYSSAESSENFFDWSVISVDEITLGDDKKSTTTLSTLEEKVNVHGDLFSDSISVKSLQNFQRVKDGNKRLTEIKETFKECEYRTEKIGAVILKSCIKGTGIDDNLIRKSSSIVAESGAVVIDVTYEEINKSLYTFSTRLNESIGLDWFSTDFTYNILTKAGELKVAFVNGESMVCDNYMPNSIHTCEYRGVKYDIPPSTSDMIFSDLDYKANERFVDTRVRFDQEVAELYLNYIQKSGLYSQ